ncbi:MAG TPA: GGDEF domain-containing protein [Thermoanaerobaculia bacterium]|nr:GGDEF domain-containing protein [Thermoanaerobaculia bacterium]
MSRLDDTRALLEPQFTYPVIGLLLGAGAPIGSLLLRFLSIRAVRAQPFEDLRIHAFFYLYELLATSLVFAIAGFAAGRRAGRLRRGKAFYHHLAEHDSLTGLHNARALTDRYQRTLEHAAATHEPLAILLIDVDKLKEINDAFGHAAGDHALVLVADALRSSKRAADLAARWGGDEFAILLPDADITAAMRVAEDVITYLRNLPDRHRGTVSVTIGICAAATPSHSSDLFAVADRALLAGKAHGRNTIEAISI